MDKQRQEVQMEAAKLPPAFNMFFWCRLRQYGIMREQAYDKAMGHPTHDFTDVKTEIAAGRDIHEIVHLMPWPFREAYQLVMGSMLDGESHRTVLMAMIAGQLPPPTMPWGGGMMPGMWPGMMPNGPEEGEQDGENPPDKRKAMFSFFGGKKNGHTPEPPPQIRRRANRGNKR